MILVSFYIILSIIKTSETSPNNALKKEENSVKNIHLNSTDLLAPSSETDQSEMRTPIAPVLISPPGPTNFEQELTKLKGFAKFIDPSGNRLLNPDDFKDELKKIEDLTKLFNQTESLSFGSEEDKPEVEKDEDLHGPGDQTEFPVLNGEEVEIESKEIGDSDELIDKNKSLIFKPKEVKHELNKLQKFLQFIEPDRVQPLDPEKVSDEIFKLFEIGKLFNPNVHLDLNSNEAQLFLEKLKKIVKISSEENNPILNLENVFEAMGRLEELVRIFTPEGSKILNFEDVNRINAIFKKICEQDNSINFKNLIDNEGAVLEKYTEIYKNIDNNESGRVNNSDDINQDFKKFKEFVKLFELSESGLFSPEKFDQEFERLKEFAAIYDLNVVRTVDFDKLEREIEKISKLSELLSPDQPLTLNVKEFESKLTKLKKFSEIINTDGSKFLEGEVEKNLEKIYKLAHSMNKKGLETLKANEIENELERLDGLVAIFDLNEHKTLSFDVMENELERLTNIAKVINTNQEQSFNLDDIESKLKKYIESTGLTTMQLEPNSDGKRSEEEEPINTVDGIQDDAHSTEIKEIFLKEINDEMKQPELDEKKLKHLDDKGFQSDSAGFVSVSDPDIPQDSHYFTDKTRVNFQGDDPSVYLDTDVFISQVLNQQGDIKKSIEKLQELIKTIKSEIKTNSTGKVKFEIPQEVSKLINLTEAELKGSGDLERKIEILYDFAESLKNDKSSNNTEGREQELLNLEKLTNITETSDFKDSKLEQELLQVDDKKINNVVSRRAAKSENGQMKHGKSSKKTNTIKQIEYKKVNKPSRSQKTLQVVEESCKNGFQGKKFIDKKDRSTKFQLDKENLQSKFVKSRKNIQEDTLYGDDPNAYNSLEIPTKIVKYNAGVPLNKNDQFQSSKLESVSHNPKMLLSARKHEDHAEENVVDNSQIDNLNGFVEKNELHSQKDSDFHKNIRKVEVGELKPNIILHFTFTRSL